MEGEDSIKDLKSQRTTLKTRVTILSNKIKTSSDPKSVLKDLESAYENFCDVHFQYAELVSDERFETYRLVSGLDIEHYLSSVTDQYKLASQYYSEWHAQSCINQSKVIISRAKGIVAAKHIAANQDYVFDIINQCDQILSALISYNADAKYDAAVLELGEIITKLNTIVVSTSRPKSPSQPQTMDLVNQDVLSVPSNIRGEGSSTLGLSGQGIVGDELRLSAQVGAASTPATESSNSPMINPEGLQVSASAQVASVTQPNAVTTSTSTVTQVSPSVPQRPASNANTSVSVLGSNEFPYITSSTLHYTGNSNTSSIVSAYDKLPHGSLYPTVQPDTVPVLHYANPNPTTYAGRPKRIIGPQSFSGERKKWPEFRSTWIRYSTEFFDDFDRVTALKELLKGEALTLVASIYAVQPDAYQRIMTKLHSHYGDPGLCVDAVLDDLAQLRQVKENDRSGLVNFINKVEAAYCQLGEVGHIATITMPHVDKLVDLLPSVLQREWMMRLAALPGTQHDRPFRQFMSFLETERTIAVRWAEREKVRATHNKQLPTERSNRQSVKTFFGNSEAGNEVSMTTQKDNHSSMYCVIHKSKNHSLSACKGFSSLSVKQRFDLVKSHSICVKCLEKHANQSCQVKECSNCNMTNHHVLLCRKSDNKEKHAGNGTNNQANKQSSYPKSASKLSNTTDATAAPDTTPEGSVVANSNHGLLEGRSSVFPIQNVKVAGSSKKATVFFDGGSNATFISNNAAKKFGARRVQRIDLDVTTLGNSNRSELTYQYALDLLTDADNTVTIKAYGLDQITSAVQQLNSATLAGLFPTIDDSLLLREAGQVDILVGNDYFGLHPKNEVAKAGEHLSVLRSPFGLCLQGSHPALSNMSSHFPLMHASLHPFIGRLAPILNTCCLAA